MLSSMARRFYELALAAYRKRGEFRYDLDHLKRSKKFRAKLDKLFGHSIKDEDLDEILSELINADYFRMVGNEIKITKPLAD